jgi:hypothetical protein
MLTYALTTWPHLKAYLRSEVEDPLLAEALIDAATVAIEAKVRNALVSRAFTDQHSGGVNGHRGGAKRLYLSRYPINSITSITDSGTPTNTIAATDYTVHHAFLEHVASWPAPTNPGHWAIVFNAGRFASIDAVDENARLACHMQVAYWLNRPREPVVSVSGSGRSRSYEFIGTPTLIPEVLPLLADYCRVEV